MSALRFRGPVLPDGEARDIYVVDGQVSFEPIASAEHVVDGWIVPGLVDAHCHVGLDQHGAVDEETQEEQAVTDRDAGALLLRDCGSAADTAWIHDRDDLPRLIRAGRHLARTKRYIRDYAHEVEPQSRSSNAPASRSVTACSSWVSSSTAPCWSRPTWQCASTSPGTIHPSTTCSAEAIGSKVTRPSTT